MTYGNYSLLPKSLRGMDWVPSSHTYHHYAGGGIVFTNADKGTNDTLTLAKMNFAMKQYNGIHRATVEPLPDFKSMPSISGWKSERQFRFVSGNIVFLYDLKDELLYAEHGVEGEMENRIIHDESGNIAYTEGANVFVKYPGGLPVQVSFDSAEGVVNGVSVHRNEFGINGGMFWSPEGRRLAYYRMDESMVTQYPIYDIDKMPAQGDNIRYPFAGAPSHHVTLWVFDLKKGRSIPIKTEGPAEQYLTNIAFSPDEKSVYIAIVNRDQNHMWLNEYNAETGEFEKTLFEEKHDKYVEPEHPMYWLNKNEFIWQSERDGFNHLYLYNREGQLLKQLTKGEWIVQDLLQADAKGKTVYFMASKQSPLNSNLYAVTLKDGSIKELTTESGVHRSSVSYDGRYVLDQYSSAEVPNVHYLLNTKDGSKKSLLKADNPLKEYELGQTEVFTLQNDGVDLYCRVIKPTHFDPNKKYPVVVYVYGGPHLQLIKNNWLSGANLWMHYMAQQGYVVFVMDSRGSDGRGLNFENATHRQLGTVEMSDQLVGANWLKQQSYVDGNRMAIHGWSFGGFMTTTLMTRAPGTFKVGVAGGPVIDWAMYEIMYTERYMDRPEENPEGYETANLLNYVQNLDGKLLMIHGTSDDVVLWQHSLKYVRKAVEKEVLMDYFVYPEHLHNVRGKDRIHLYRKVTEYIQDNLDD
ncbi:MAG: S9 family peptidase [Bacteroidota bacterium]|nr:S9 family peptidase [Bacteroidota bacterium]MDX5430018.1 S9 family peptidase [Bacteroidota bacterium]MDX5468788.1 S9 family peptidase [Bacteroidota bacterium]